MNDEQTLSVDKFIRSIAVNRKRPICFLLGAGASISSGMPSAERCIWEWKQDIFVTNNPALRDSVGEISLPGTRNKIQRWLDQRGQYPLANGSEEYSFYAKECYPTGQDRRSFFQSYVVQAKPHTGYRLLPLLVKAGHIRTVWTTNFDGMAARACSAADVTCIEVGIDTALRTTRPLSQGELRIVSLHGDYRYDELKNTQEELQQQESAFRSELLHELRDYDLVVIGYSGRDKSIMDILWQSITENNKSRLFWCGYGNEVSLPVAGLLTQASLGERDAFYVPTEGFDDILSRLALRLLDGESLKEAKSLLATTVSSSRTPSAFSISSNDATHLVKSNAYPLTCPAQVMKLDVVIPDGVRARDWLNSKLGENEGVIVSIGRSALAFCESNHLTKAFGRAIQGQPYSVELSENEILSDMRIQSLMRRTLVQSAAKKLNVETDGNHRVWEGDFYNTRSHNNTKYRIHRALFFRLVSVDGKLHVALMPEIVAKQLDGQLADRESTKILRSEIYGYQHNHVFNEDLNFWIKRISNVDIPAIGRGVFRIDRVPIFAGLFQKGARPLIKEELRYAKQRGLIIDDAALIFSALNGKSEVRDTNPLKGLVNNRPWDYELTRSGLSPAIEIAAVCPRIDRGKFAPFLGRLHERSVPSQQERDYLQDFPGFSAAFGLPLISPNPGESLWVELDDAVPGDVLTKAKNLAQRICRALDIVRSLKPGAVTAIFVPARWEPYKIIETEHEQFNLRDYIKAYAARQGQSTQFIREETVATTQPCRVRWWLSLALYAKALRTPWRIDSLDNEAAFVGIGYSIDTKAARGSHILLGCSHLYSARGEGLQFRLGRIENPIIRGRNPFMSEGDARRTGETIRQLFYDARMCLPNRVVIHKRTPFTPEEIRGLFQGLDGVENIELIEINIEESLRYLSSKHANGRLEIDKFPVPRGALVIQNPHTALLWVHGATPSAYNNRFKYYQGKRRIPAPLVIRRYLGQSDIIQVATEVLGLSKMNWNTFDYYSRLPATLESAGAIARTGAYLSGFGYLPYDYRLLI